MAEPFVVQRASRARSGNATFSGGPLKCAFRERHSFRWTALLLLALKSSSLAGFQPYPSRLLVGPGGQVATETARGGMVGVCPEIFPLSWQSSFISPGVVAAEGDRVSGKLEEIIGQRRDRGKVFDPDVGASRQELINIGSTPRRVKA